MTSAYAKPLPTPNAEDREFWEAARQHRLVLPHCEECGHTWFPPYLACPKCISPQRVWINASGKGTIWASIEMHQAYMPPFRGDLPYQVALIRLEEGPLMFSQVIGKTKDQLPVGTSVEVVFDDVTATVTLPQFRVVEQA